MRYWIPRTEHYDTLQSFCAEHATACEHAPQIDFGEDPFALHSGGRNANANAHMRNLIGVILVALFLILGVALYLAFGRVPRRWRATRRQNRGLSKAGNAEASKPAARWRESAAVPPSIPRIQVLNRAVSCREMHADGSRPRNTKVIPAEDTLTHLGKGEPFVIESLTATSGQEALRDTKM
jgi:hypothetical protein